MCSKGDERETRGVFTGWNALWLLLLKTQMPTLTRVVKIQPISLYKSTNWGLKSWRPFQKGSLEKMVWTFYPSCFDTKCFLSSLLCKLTKPLVQSTSGYCIWLIAYVPNSVPRSTVADRPPLTFFFKIMLKSNWPTVNPARSCGGSCAKHLKWIRFKVFKSWSCDADISPTTKYIRAFNLAQRLRRHACRGPLRLV